MQTLMHNYSDWVSQTDPGTLDAYYSRLLKHSGFNVLDVCSHHFHPHGYTALYLLGESHFAVHTFPERELTYIELSSCVRGPFLAFVKAAQQPARGAT